MVVKIGKSDKPCPYCGRYLYRDGFGQEWVHFMVNGTQEVKEKHDIYCQDKQKDEALRREK